MFYISFWQMIYFVDELINSQELWKSDEYWKNQPRFASLPVKLRYSSELSILSIDSDFWWRLVYVEHYL